MPASVPIVTTFNSLYSSVLKWTAVSILFYAEDNRRRFVQNVCTHLPNPEVSHPRRPYLYAAAVHNAACSWSHDSKFVRLSNFSLQCSACWCLWISLSSSLTAKWISRGGNWSVSAKEKWNCWYTKLFMDFVQRMGLYSVRVAECDFYRCFNMRKRSE